MSIIKGLSRLGAVVASQAVIAVSFASGASASTSVLAERSRTARRRPARPLAQPVPGPGL